MADFRETRDIRDTGTRISEKDLNPDADQDYQYERRSTKRTSDDKPDDFVTRGELERKLRDQRHQTAEAFNTRIHNIEELIDDKIDSLRIEFKRAFQGEDPTKHRMWHDVDETKEKDKASLIKQLKEKLITSGVWAGLVLLAVAVWEYIKAGVHK